MTDAADTFQPASRHPRASIHDLALVRFRTETQMSDAIRQWKYDRPIMVAESCARQVWVGTRADLADFPVPSGNTNGIVLSAGVEAYTFLLHLITGNDSAKLGESSIAGQFYTGWQAYEEKHPELARRFVTLMQHIRADTAMIRTNIINFIKPQRAEMAARYLSGQKRGERALVVGHAPGGREPETALMTEALFKALGNTRQSRVRQITVTHPKTAALTALYNTLSGLKAAGIVAADVICARAPFTALSAEIERHQRVFTDMPMGMDSCADAVLVNAWQNRAERSNTLTHLRGDPHAKGLSAPVWTEAGLDNYIPPEWLRAEMAAIGRENHRLRLLAGHAADYCAAMRAAGDTPNWHKYSRLHADTVAAPKIA